MNFMYQLVFMIPGPHENMVSGVTGLITYSNIVTNLLLIAAGCCLLFAMNGYRRKNGLQFHPRDEWKSDIKDADTSELLKFYKLAFYKW